MFTLYSGVLLFAISAPSYLWFVWVIYQIVGWIWFLVHTFGILEYNQRYQELLNENDDLREAILPKAPAASDRESGEADAGGYENGVKRNG